MPVTAARFPSVILSTLSGNAVGTKDYRMAVVFVIVTAVVSGVGVLIYRSFSKKHAEKKRNQQANTDAENGAKE